MKVRELGVRGVCVGGGGYHYFMCLARGIMEHYGERSIMEKGVDALY